ncbi:hypothetical protein [Paraburkholderia sp. EG304]|uniref:hypothetical protein n=1 Tax=Paraburkholderia sp. EG304 TaxID=3237015 RepID=UPI0039799C15
MESKNLIEHDTDEHGSPLVTVIGVDRESVYSTALDLKNATPVEQCPEVCGPKLDLDSGCWRATVIVRNGVPV